VEDDDAARQVATRILRQHGYKVMAAALPSVAEEILADQGGQVALLLTDVVMPERSGRSLVEWAQVRYPHLRVLHMSGYTADAIAHHGVLDAGIALLQKPFTAEALLRKVRDVLGEAHVG
jgi:DNA-binding NtrC family response regulator